MRFLDYCNWGRYRSVNWGTYIARRRSSCRGRNIGLMNCTLLKYFSVLGHHPQTPQPSIHSCHIITVLMTRVAFRFQRYVFTARATRQHNAQRAIMLSLVHLLEVDQSTRSQADRTV